MRARGGAAVPLPRATQLPGFRGTQDTVFTLAEGLNAGQPLYAHVEVSGTNAEPMSFSSSTLDRTLARGAEHARIIALTFGALMAVSLAALLIWFVLVDRIFILYATLFFLQALYVAYLSGEGFDWPWLSYAQPLDFLRLERARQSERCGGVPVHARDRRPEAFFAAKLCDVRLVCAGDSSS